MRIYLVTYSHEGKRKYWHESLNASCAATLANILDEQGKEPKAILIKGDAKVLASALVSSGTQFRFRPPFEVATPDPLSA